MAYTQYDDTKPVNTQTGTAIPADILANCNALRDAIVMGQMQGFALSISGGTNEQPQYYLFTKGTTIVRATPTWGNGTPAGTLGNITACKWEKSLNSGGAYDAILSADQAFTYDTSGNLTAVSNGGGLISIVLYLLGKVKKVVTDLATHAALTGSSAHGLGSISTQAASAVAVTGGTVDGTPIGNTTPAAVTAQIFKGKCIDKGSVNASTPIDVSTGDYFYITFTGASAAITFTGLPAADRVQAWTVEINNAAAATSPWPTVAWPNGVAPTRGTGIDIYEFFCRNGSTIRGVQAAKNSA